MYKKVLVAEDLDSISIAVIQVLEDLQVQTIDHVKYCDDGLLKIKKAIQENNPYDLLNLTKNICLMTVKNLLKQQMKFSLN